MISSRIGYLLPCRQNGGGIFATLDLLRVLFAAVRVGVKCIGPLTGSSRVIFIYIIG